MNYRDLALNFSCRGEQLYGVASVPSQPGKRGVLIVVGGPQYRVGSHRQFTLLARSLAQQGIATMRFDYRGMGDSDGAARTFESVDEDLGAAIDHFQRAVPEVSEVVIWGLCDAASAALFYAAKDTRVSGLVLLNPWVRTDAGLAKATIKHYYRERLFDPTLWRKIASGHFDFAAAAGAFLRLARNAAGAAPPASTDQPTCTLDLPGRMLAGITEFKGKVLLIISPRDLTAREFLDTVDASEPWRRILAEPRVKRETLADADHTFSRHDWREQVAAWTASWVTSW